MKYLVKENNVMEIKHLIKKDELLKGINVSDVIFVDCPKEDVEKINNCEIELNCNDPRLVGKELVLSYNNAYLTAKDLEEIIKDYPYAAIGADNLISSKKLLDRKQKYFFAKKINNEEIKIGLMDNVKEVTDDFIIE